MENKEQNHVIVYGDRQIGKFEVKLIKRMKHIEVDNDDIIYQAKIINIVDDKYAYKINDIVYVVKDSDKEFWGGINPIIKEELEN